MIHTDSSCCLIHDQTLRPPYKCPRESDDLPLPLGEVGSTVLDGCIQTNVTMRRLTLNPKMAHSCLIECIIQYSIIMLSHWIEILSQCSCKKIGTLWYDRYVGPKSFQVQLRSIETVEMDSSSSWDCSEKSKTQT